MNTGHVPHQAITAQRLAHWAEKLASEVATPFVLLGVSHGDKRGQLVICVVDDEEVTKQTIVAFLRSAIRLVERT